MDSISRLTPCHSVILSLRWLTLAVLFACSGATAAGDDNVLGLPKPRDARRPGAVILNGGGSISNETWDRFLALAGGSKARIVIVPSAGFRPSDYDNDEQFRAALQGRFGAWLRLVPNGKAASVEFLYTDNPNDAESDAFVKPLTTATAVWFSGGLQSRLNYRFVGYFPKPTKFQTALREVVERGGVVGGTSAGMAALPEIMTISQERRDGTGPMSAVPAHGLGLFTGAIVEQHFDARSGRLERFTGLMRDTALLDQWAGREGVGAKMVGLAVEEGTGLLLQGDRVEVLGGSHAHIFVNSAGGATLTWHTLKVGEKGELKRDRHGDVTMSRDGH